jgi:hypothetical protein
VKPASGKVTGKYGALDLLWDAAFIAANGVAAVEGGAVSLPCQSLI